MRIVFVTLIAAIAGLLSCDRTTVNNYTTDATGIAGTVSPIDGGTVMAITETDTFTTPISGDGFFIHEGLRPGIYRVIVRPNNYSRRLVSNVIVVTGAIVQLKAITLSTLPYPIYQSFPPNGQTGVYRNSVTRFVLYCDEGLDTVSLRLGTTTNPPLPGNWTMSGPLNYVYSAPVPLRTATTYSLMLDQTVTTASGQPLEKDLVLSFTTEQLKTLVTLPPVGASGAIRLNGFIPYVRFNDSVNIDSASRAIRFEPDLAGEWLLYSSSDGQWPTTLRFLPTGGPPQPETQYDLIISDQINLVGTTHLAVPDTTTFITEPYGVTDYYPRDGQTASPSTSIGLAFNIAMDTASVEAAFTLVDTDSNAVPGVYYWSGLTQASIQLPSGALQSGRVYRMKLTTAARALSGVNLTHEFNSYFVVY
jgi:hypothetical protein